MAALTQADQNKIIQSVIDELNKYESRFWTTQRMKKTRKDVLKNKKKGYWDAAWGSELGYLKEEIRNNLVAELDNMKSQPFDDPKVLISEIKKTIKRVEDEDLTHIRSYEYKEYVPGHGDVTHKKTTHDKGRLENFTFNRIRENLDDLHSSYQFADTYKVDISYAQNLLLQDIQNQIWKIKEDGGFNDTGKWKSKKYEQKYNVLVGMGKFLIDAPRSAKADEAADEAFADLLNHNKKYRATFFGKSNTAKLLDRVLEARGKHLEKVPENMSPGKNRA